LHRDALSFGTVLKEQGEMSSNPEDYFAY